MSKKLCLILGDQLSIRISSLLACKKKEDLVLMAEVASETSYVKHHQKKIAFLFSAMRHFALELKAANYQLIYTKLDDPENTGSLTNEVKRLIAREKTNKTNKIEKIEKIIVTQPGEYRVLEEILSWEKLFQVPVEILPDNRFLVTLEEFKKWATKRKQLRMEYFYREIREKYTILMEGKKPLGGKWNYDRENRKPPKEKLKIPKTYKQPPDQITQEVLALVAREFGTHFGELEPFEFAVRREEALAALELFVEERLPCFGDYQDAMLEEEPWMYHGHLSFYLNCGLLLPLECVKAAERAYYQGKAPLNAVEGFIRQIIGWREYVRGIYWLKMPEYLQLNFLQAKRKLPAFYWTGKTEMNCLRQVIKETQKNAYAHHIQRLMILGNFALLTGIRPLEVSEWFLSVYADAYEWVELPNVLGMSLFADGGYLASKPYASSGSYIEKMSNYCQNCSYKIKEKDSARACPFNYLYWHFLASNYSKLRSNPRLGMIYKTYERMGEEKKAKITLLAENFLETLETK